jgi:nuclease-like protein
MAKFYGDTDPYLRNKDVEYYFFAGVLALFPFAALTFLLWAFTHTYTAASFAIIIFATIAFVVMTGPIITQLKVLSGRYYRGRLGEKSVRQLLQKLPDDYSVFCDVRLGDHKGNLDFVVVGPGGVFILEVKSHGGEIGYNGYALTVNGHTFADKNFFNQIHGQTWALKNYLDEHGAGGIYIHSALVFSHPHARTHFGYNLTNHIYIIQKDFLLGLFSQCPVYYYAAAPKEKVEAVLAEVAR